MGRRPAACPAPWGPEPRWGCSQSPSARDRAAPTAAEVETLLRKDQAQGHRGHVEEHSPAQCPLLAGPSPTPLPREAFWSWGNCFLSRARALPRSCLHPIPPPSCRGKLPLSPPHGSRSVASQGHPSAPRGIPPLSRPPTALTPLPTPATRPPLCRGCDTACFPALHAPSILFLWLPFRLFYLIHSEWILSFEKLFFSGEMLQIFGEAERSM